MNDATVSPHKSESIATAWIPGPMLHTTRRIILAVLTVVAVALLLASIKFPYWKVTLKAPQYPQGLHVSIFLNKVEGDTSEVDLLNHYIGMRKLEDAAQFERNIAIYGIAFVSLFTLLFVLSGRKVMSLFALPALIFPFAFILDLFFWLYTFGHKLDPHAPISFTPFTPRLVGEGVIGQFATVGTFGVGFYLVIASFVLVLAGLILRFTVCNACPYREGCSLVCPHLFLWPPREYQKQSP